MPEPPVDLPGDTLAAGLRAHYGLAVRAITFLSLGQDSSAWKYRVQTADGALYFLKVRESVTNAPSLLAPRYLHDHGVAPVVAPLSTTAGHLWAVVAGYTLILYPFIAGTTGMANGMSGQQWIAYGTILRQIHATALVPELADSIRRETFVPEGVAAVRAVEAHIHGHTYGDPAARNLAALWHERRGVIHTLTDRAEELGRKVAERGLPCVLCHGDIHTNNVLLDTGGAVWIVDWDDTVLAPKERDLMFVLGGGLNRQVAGPREEELFSQGYGPAVPDPLALAYYRYARAVSDIGEYGAQVFLRPDLSMVTRQAAIERFLRVFEPGRIVALLLASDGKIT